MSNLPSGNYFSPENLSKLRLVPPPGPERDGPLPHSPSQGHKPHVSRQFLRGPISMAWLAKAAKLRGKAPLAVALTIRFESGRCQNSPTVKLTNPLVAKLGVSRKSKYAALRALQEAGLVEVDQEPRKAPMVTIIEQG